MTRSRICTCFLTTVLYCVIIAAALLFVPGLPPTGVRYDAYRNTPATKFEPNSILDKAELFVDSKGEFTGPESMAIRGDDLYTGVSGGRILKIDKNGKVSTVSTIVGDCTNSLWDEGIKCGRPLGMRFDSAGKLVVADAFFGIFRIDVDTGKTEHLLSSIVEIDGKKPMLPDDLALGSNGEIYWSDASTVGTLRNSLPEFLGSGSGRLIKFDPATKTTTVLLDNLHFANGVHLSPDEDFVLVSETMRCRIWRYFLKGPKKGQSEIFLDGLPGLPDNIRSNGRGGYYIALPNTRDPDHPDVAMESLGSLPLVRKLIARKLGVIDLILSYVNMVVPSSPELYFLRMYLGHLGPLADPKNFPKKVIIMDVSADGKTVRALQTNQSEMRTITEASAGEEYTYFGSFTEPKIWRIKNNFLAESTKPKKVSIPKKV